MTCGSCGSEVAGGRFCGQCGSRLALTCPSCGTENPPSHRFCNECGSALGAAGTTAAVAERRLVSVLFADLVGFTTLAEHRDPEEVRELLSAYFDRCRVLIERYGGTVEKFIGDAVMAVWGSPVAREDDAERAVRAALALAPAVGELGLTVRVGVLTGRAAVELGAEAEGMVLGDTVNTAARLQGLAPPGGVLVDDVTRRATEAAIAYEDAGTHQVKGRDQPVRAWRALRVVALVGGAQRSGDLEAPFVGRAADLSLIVERFETAATEGRARLVTVLGAAGSGKSRLQWEFTKYLDGILGAVLWHRGRCLSYGEGVAFSALADMVRTRARIAEDEDPDAARAKLAQTVGEILTDERERALVEPRLAHLLGLQQRSTADRGDLFSAWRLFFERLAARDPVALVFEDLQWADTGLLDFIDHLVEWSADLPIFVLALARPELLERRPGWAEDHDRIDLVRLDPLPAEAMDELLQGLVPGLPPELCDSINRRAEGVPLYAVETVRMLLDRDVLVRDGERYVVRGEIGQLEVPETLHALVAARLDGLTPAERALAQTASVLGQTFTQESLIAIADQPSAQVATGLHGLVGKQVLRVEDDPLSPGQGEYGFLQQIVRTVAYETLSRRDRKALHLAAARHLRATAAGDPRAAELLASHELAAVRADPDAPDAPALRASARATLAEAGDRASSLAAGDEASRYYEQAAELSTEPTERADLLARAGDAAATQGQEDRALELYDAAIGLLEPAGRPRAVAAVTVQAAEIHLQRGMPALAREHLVSVLDVLGDHADEVLAAALTKLARAHMFDVSGMSEALELTERALEVAEALRAAPPIADALTSRGVALALLGRVQESTALLVHARDFATRHELAPVALRAGFNLAEVQASSGSLDDARDVIGDVVRHARERGDRRWEEYGREQLLLICDLSGRWEEALAHARDLRDPRRLAPAGTVLSELGELELLEAGVAAHEALDFDSLGPEDQAAAWILRATLARARGASAAAVDAAAQAFPLVADAALLSTVLALRELRLSALAAPAPDRLAAALDTIDALPPNLLTPMLAAEAALLRADLAAPADAQAAYAHAVEVHRPLGTPFGLAQSLLGQGEALRRHGDERAAAPLLDEARAIFEAIGARRWIERAQRPAATAA